MSAARRGNVTPRRWDYAYDRRRRASGAVVRRWSLPELSWGRVRLVPILVALLGILAVVFGLLLYNSSLFKVTSVEVTGVNTLNSKTIIEIADAHGENIITLDMEAVKRRLEANPYIDTAVVSRDWPGGLDIVVIERVPIAVWQVGSRSFLVDAEGLVMGVLEGEVPVGTIPVAAVVADVPTPGSRIDPQVVELLARLKADVPARTGDQIASFEYSSAFGLTAILTSGVRVVVGDASDYAYKLASLAAVIQGARDRGLPFSEIDLRFGVSPAVR